MDFLYIPYEVCNETATFSRLMGVVDVVLPGITRLTDFTYLDNIVVFGATC